MPVKRKDGKIGGTGRRTKIRESQSDCDASNLHEVEQKVRKGKMGRRKRVRKGRVGVGVERFSNQTRDDTQIQDSDPRMKPMYTC